MNVTLAEAALGDARRHLDRFYMGTWFGKDHDDGDAAIFIKEEGQTVPPCGTTACFAGFVALREAPAGSVIRNGVIEMPSGKKREVSGYAENLLDITDDQGDVLWFVDNLSEVTKLVDHLIENPDATKAELCDVVGWVQGQDY